MWIARKKSCFIHYIFYDHIKPRSKFLLMVVLTYYDFYVDSTHHGYEQVKSLEKALDYLVKTI